jgi:hypothetical protein
VWWDETLSHTYDTLHRLIRDSSVSAVDSEFSELLYDDQNRVVAVTRTSHSDGSTYVTHYAYQQFEVTITDQPIGGSVDHISVRKFDSSGRVISETSDNLLDSSRIEEIHTYDPQGSTIREIKSKCFRISPDSSIERLDSQNKLIELIGYNNTGDIQDKWSCKYDRDGNIVLRQRYQKITALYEVTRWLYEYFEK